MRLVLVAAGIVALFAAGGAAGGWVWHRLWNPPAGQAVKGVWYPADETSLGGMFDATGLYLCVGVAGGLVLGALVALLVRRAELLVLAAAVVGSVVAAWLCHRVGFSLAPPDPAGPAAHAPDFTTIPDTMHTPGHSFYVAWPLGTLAGVGLANLVVSSVSRRRDTAAGTTLYPPHPASGH